MSEQGARTEHCCVCGGQIHHAAAVPEVAVKQTKVRSGG